MRRRRGQYGQAGDGNRVNEGVGMEGKEHQAREREGSIKRCR